MEAVLAENKKHESCSKWFSKKIKSIINCCGKLCNCFSECINCCTNIYEWLDCPWVSCDKCCKSFTKYYLKKKCSCCCFDDYVYSPTKIVPLPYKKVHGKHSININKENEEEVLSSENSNSKSENKTDYSLKKKFISDLNTMEINLKEHLKKHQKEILSIKEHQKETLFKIFSDKFRRFVINEKIFKHYQENNDKDEINHDEYDAEIENKDVHDAFDKFFDGVDKSHKTDTFKQFINQMCLEELENDEPIFKQNLEKIFEEDKKEEEKEEEDQKQHSPYEIIDAIINYYHEYGFEMTSNQVLSLSPIAYINNGELQKKFLGAVLEDIDKNKLFQASRVELLKNIVLYGKRSSNGLCNDDILACIEIVIKKIKHLTIDRENENIQLAMDSLCDLLYIAGSVLKMNGVPYEKRKNIKKAISLLKQHNLHKIYNKFKGLFIDPGLKIKHKYAVKALSYIGGPDLEDWEIFEKFVESHMLFILSTITCVFSGNPTGILNSINEIKQVYTQLCPKPPEAYDINSENDQEKKNEEKQGKSGNDINSENHQEKKNEGKSGDLLKTLVSRYNDDNKKNSEADPRVNPKKKETKPKHIKNILMDFLNIEYVSKYSDDFKQIFKKFNFKKTFDEDVIKYKEVKKNIAIIIKHEEKLQDKKSDLNAMYKKLDSYKQNLKNTIKEIKSNIDQQKIDNKNIYLEQCENDRKTKITNTLEFFEKLNPKTEKNSKTTTGFSIKEKRVSDFYKNSLILTNHGKQSWFDKVNILRSVESMEIDTIIDCIYRLNMYPKKKNEIVTYYCIKTLVNVIRDLSRKMSEQIKAIYILYAIYHNLDYDDLKDILGSETAGNDEIKYKVGSGAFHNTLDIKYYIRKQLGGIYLSVGPNREFVKYVSYNVLHRLCTYENVNTIHINDYLNYPFLLKNLNELKLDSNLIVKNAIRRLEGKQPYDLHLYVFLKDVETNARNENNQIKGLNEKIDVLNEEKKSLEKKIIDLERKNSNDSKNSKNAVHTKSDESQTDQVNSDKIHKEISNQLEYLFQNSLLKEQTIKEMFIFMQNFLKMDFSGLSSSINNNADSGIHKKPSTESPENQNESKKQENNKDKTEHSIYSKSNVESKRERSKSPNKLESREHQTKEKTFPISTYFNNHKIQMFSILYSLIANKPRSNENRLEDYKILKNSLQDLNEHIMAYLSEK